MRIARSLASNIRPTAIYVYVDRITVWIKHPLSQAKITSLGRYCGGVHVLNEPARFDLSFKQRLQLWQPTAAVLRRLNKIPRIHLNYVELSLDWIFDKEAERDEAFDFVDRYHIKKYRRDLIRFNKSIRYTGSRSASNLLAIYADRECKLTGEVCCVHFDWRLRRPANLERVGLKTVRDVLALDHLRFWEHRLLLSAVDARKLGRMQRNHFRSTRRRSWVTVSRNGFRYDKDARTGAIMFRMLGSTEKLLDVWGRKIRVRDCLIPIDVRHLLPSRRTSFL